MKLHALENAKQLSGDKYHQILTEFNVIIEDEPQSTKQDLIRTLIRKVESTV